MKPYRDSDGSTDLPDLSALDPAERSGDRAISAGAQQLLTRIVSTPRASAMTDDVGTPARGRPQYRSRWTLAALLAFILTVAAVAVPVLLGGKNSTAFASYTATPIAVPADVATGAMADCRAVGTDAADPVIAALTERRGKFIFTLVATDTAFGTCFALDGPPNADPSEETGVVSWGPTQDLPAPAADEVEAVWGGIFRTSSGATFTSATGRIGDRVTAVRVVPGGQESILASTVRTSTAGGWFTAWWPGEPEQDLTVVLTLRDGSQVERVLGR